jgi:hypothetical protein
MAGYIVIRTPAFDLLAADYARIHPKLKEDIDWLSGRLAEAPQLMGDHVPELGPCGAADFQNAVQGFLPQNRRVRRVADLLRAAQAGQENIPSLLAPQKGIPKPRSQVPAAEAGARVCQRGKIKITTKTKRMKEKRALMLPPGPSLNTVS